MNTPVTQKPAHNHAEAFCLMKYASADGRIVEWLWNSQDGVTPFCIMSKDGQTELRHIDWQRDEYRPAHQLQEGDRYFAPLTREAAVRYAARRMQQAEGTPYELQGEERTAMEASIAEQMLKDATPDILVHAAPLIIDPMADYGQGRAALAAGWIVERCYVDQNGTPMMWKPVTSISEEWDASRYRIVAPARVAKAAPELFLALAGVTPIAEHYINRAHEAGELAYPAGNHSELIAAAAALSAARGDARNEP